MARLRICDVCRGTEPKPEWIKTRLEYHRGNTNSTEIGDYCSYDCYIRDLEDQINITRALQQEQIGGSIPKIGG